MKNKTLTTVITIIVILVLIFLAWYFVKNNQEANNEVIDNNNVSLNETLDNEDASNNDTENEINYENDEGLSLENPQKNKSLSNPINIRGEATGPWYFEGDFRVQLVDRDSRDLITESYVSAQGDWMTEERVAFSGTLEYEAEEETEALLILESANPSGLDENQMTYTVPLTLSASN